MVGFVVNFVIIEIIGYIIINGVEEVMFLLIVMLWVVVLVVLLGLLGSGGVVRGSFVLDIVVLVVVVVVVVVYGEGFWWVWWGGLCVVDIFRGGNRVKVVRWWGFVWMFVWGYWGKVGLRL